MDQLGFVIETRGGFELTIDLSLSFEKMVELGNYDHVSPSVTEELFPLHGRYGDFIKVSLVDCSGLSRPDALKHIDSLNLVPADMTELLEFGHLYPDMQKQRAIVALGDQANIAPFLFWTEQFGRLLGVVNCDKKTGGILFLQQSCSSKWWFLALAK